MNLTRGAREAYRQLKNNIEASTLYKGKYNDMLHSYRGEGERVLTNSFIAEHMSVGCAHNAFGVTKPTPDDLRNYTMPSMSLLSVLAAVAACHSSDGIKMLYWTRYEKTKIEERQLSLAHIMLPDGQTSRVVNGNPSYVRVYTNNKILWDTIVTLG